MFPPVECATVEGLLAIGGDLNVETLRLAYTSGIFPWPVEDYPILWFAPQKRSILPFDEFHIPRSLQKQLRRTSFELRIDTAFERVIESCAAQRRDAEGTWITDEMLCAYTDLHRAGDAHSVETYLDGELVGGLYGVAFGAYFAGESMFHAVSGASKAAVIHLVSHLRARGARWLDTQMLTPLFQSFGAREISRAEFMGQLEEALSRPVRLFD